MENRSFYYRLRHKIYWGLMGFTHRVLGTWLYERKWQERAAASPGNGFSAINDPHRLWLE